MLIANQQNSRLRLGWRMDMMQPMIHENQVMVAMIPLARTAEIQLVPFLCGWPTQHSMSSRYVKSWQVLLSAHFICNFCKHIRRSNFSVSNQFLDHGPVREKDKYHDGGAGQNFFLLSLLPKILALASVSPGV